MATRKYYRAYTMNEVMGSGAQLALSPYQFKGFVANKFDSEEEAIQALENEGEQFTEFLIVPSVYILPY